MGSPRIVGREIVDREGQRARSSLLDLRFLLFQNLPQLQAGTMQAAADGADGHARTSAIVSYFALPCPS